MIKSVSVDKLLLFLLLAVSIFATYFSYTHNTVLTYNDAASHLNIARRVLDSLTPGMAQIGTVWLPLPHVLMIPFVWNNYLWHTGLGGSIVSMAAYILTAFFIYKFVLLLTGSRAGGVISALIVALNPNMLYMQTTPMTEPLLLMTITISFYYFAKFIHTRMILNLLLTGIFVGLSTLVRYDGWFLFASLLVMLPLVTLISHGWRQAESSLIVFAFSACFGIFLWLLWNLAIFGDAMYFITGPYSAYAQQRVLKEVGQLPTEGNIYMAGLYYFWAVVNNNGIVLLLASAVGLLLVPFRLKDKRYLFPVLAAISPIIFNVIALFVGQSAMNVPQAPSNPGMFNIRYGLMALPAIAVILGVVASQKYLRLIVILVVVIQGYFFLQQGVPVTLADGLYGLSQTYYTVEASKWLRENYQGGLILTSLASHDAFVQRTQLPMKYYVHEGTRDFWNDALRNPSEKIQYITVLTFPPDVVYKSLVNNYEFKTKYKLVHSYKAFQIYHRIN